MSVVTKDIPMTSHLLFLSVPGLRSTDIDLASTPTLYGWANRGVLAEMTPTFPCVTSSVQASMITGVPPARHGVIANGFYHRDRREVEMWTGWNSLIEAPQIWESLRAKGLTSAVWHAQNIKGAAADFIVTPAPIHEADGTMKLWCYSKPDGLYQELLNDLGHFPLQHYWGPLSNIESTRWILRGAAWLIDRHAPNFHWIYIPHLDYAMQKFGPNSPQARAALAELDSEFAAFVERVASSPIGKDAVFLVAGEYAMTDVTGVVYPNRILREAGLLAVEERSGASLPPYQGGIKGGQSYSCDRKDEGQLRSGAEYLDFVRSTAFALVDHQFAHIFARQEGSKAKRQEVTVGVVDLFRKVPGIAGVYVGDERAEIGMTHERCGDVVLVCDETHWLAYYWWHDDAKAPPFARTVDIHNTPGYDPVELFFDPNTRGIPLDASLVKGSHGVPATSAHHRTALVCSTPNPAIPRDRSFRDTDLFSMVQQILAP